MITAVGKGFVSTEVYYGLGRHRYYVPKEKYTIYMKFNYIDWAQCFVALAVSKISVCLFLLRLSHFNRLRHVLHGLIGFLFVTHLACLLLFLLQCIPVNKAWVEEAPGKCFSKEMIMNIIIAQGGEPTEFLSSLFESTC